MLILYHSNNSYASQKVRVYLAENNIPWLSCALDLLKQEHLTNEAYRKIHPKALVPALQDGEKIICNSTEIMEYIRDHHLVKKINLPADLSVQVHDFCKADEALHDPHLRTLSYHYRWMDKPLGEDEKNHLLTFASQHPDLARGKFLAKAVQKQLTLEEITAAKQAVLASLAEIEMLLEKAEGDFIFGKTYTMADAVAITRLSRIDFLKKNIDFEIGNYPLTSNYFQKMCEKTSYAEINATHGKDVQLVVI